MTVSNVQNIIWWYIAGINVVAVILYGWDKFCAVHDRWRISESMLLFVAAIGGSMGALLAMQIFRHKTKHLKFRLGIPLILAFQLVGAWKVLNLY